MGIVLTMARLVIWLKFVTPSTGTIMAADVIVTIMVTLSVIYFALVLICTTNYGRKMDR